MIVAKIQKAIKLKQKIKKSKMQRIRDFMLKSNKERTAEKKEIKRQFSVAFAKDRNDPNGWWGLSFKKLVSAKQVSSKIASDGYLTLIHGGKRFKQQKEISFFCYKFNMENTKTRINN